MIQPDCTFLQTLQQLQNHGVLPLLRLCDEHGFDLLPGPCVHVLNSYKCTHNTQTRLFFSANAGPNRLSLCLSAPLCPRPLHSLSVFLLLSPFSSGRKATGNAVSTNPHLSGLSGWRSSWRRAWHARALCLSAGQHAVFYSQALTREHTSLFLVAAGAIKGTPSVETSWSLWLPVRRPLLEC